MGEAKGHPFRGNQFRTVKVTAAPVAAPVLLVPMNFPKIEEPIIVIPPDYVSASIPEKDVISVLEKEKPNWVARAWKWIVE